MHKAILGAVLLGACGAAVAQTPPPRPAAVAAPAAAPTLADLKKQFETAMRDAQKANRENLKALQQQYATSLATLQTEVQAKGEMQAVLAIRDEKTRFEQTSEIPAGALVTEPAALRKAQLDWNASVQQAALAQAQRIVALSEKYMQQLAQLQKALTARNDADGLQAVNAETDRLLGNNVIREALAAVKKPKADASEKPGPDTVAKTPGPTATPPPKPEPPPPPPKPAEAKVVEVGDYKFYPPGKEPPAKDIKDQRLEFSSTERKNAAYFYTLAAKVYFDKAKMTGTKHGSYDYTIKEESGNLISIPRISITSRNKDIPEGSKLVIQYYSRHLTRATDIREERVEHIALPAIARGQTLSVDGQGLNLYKSDYRASYGYREKLGREYYGLILSVFDTDGKLLTQQCTPSSLIKSCSSSIVAEKFQAKSTASSN